MSNRAVWVVLGSTYDDVWLAAVYESEELADRHAEALGGWVVGGDMIRTTIHPDVVDPVKVAAREAEIVEAKASYEREREREREREEARRRDEIRPRPGMKLCDCPTFMAPGDRRYIAAHGYCGYCGGFTFEVFRREVGEEALQAAIDKLSEWNRKKMRRIVAGGPAEDPSHEVDGGYTVMLRVPLEPLGDTHGA